MRYKSIEEKMEILERMRKQPICQFDGITIDMDYALCIPSIHATCKEQEMIIDFGGEIRQQTESFPKDKASTLIRWVLLHKEEIANNHHRINFNNEPPIMIEPYKE